MTSSLRNARSMTFPSPSHSRLLRSFTPQGVIDPARSVVDVDDLGLQRSLNDIDLEL
ncbi:hypothetical protein J6590_095950 [Homalodisca vitripennis]|nr:hypothetical protein J6590_095950 [Homalodisca vitripennis]